MKFFSKEEPKSIEDEIADRIMQQPDRLNMLLTIFSKLPNDLVEWFKGILKEQSSTKGYVEVDIASGVSLGTGILPGDLVIRKNRDPKINDIIEIAMREEESYFSQKVKVLKINIKEGTLFVQNLSEPDSKGSIAVHNVICVIDKIVKYGDLDWKKVVQVLDIDYDTEELERWVEEMIKIVKKQDFSEKESILKKLDERLKVLKKK